MRKKSFLLFLVLAMLLSACSGGGKGTEAAPTNQATEATQFVPPTTEPVDPVPAFVAISGESRTQEINAPDGTQIFYSSLRCFSAELPEFPKAQQAINGTLEAYYDQLTQYCDVVAGQAQAGYEEWSSTAFTAYSVTVSAQCLRLDAAVICISFEESTYAGGAHLIHNSHSMCFDCSTGQELALQDVILTGSTGALAEQFGAALAQDQALSDKSPDTLAETALDCLEGSTPIAQWALTWEGLELSFAPSTLAAYASGYITVCLPYDAITQSIKAEYLPQAEPRADGTIAAGLAADSLGSEVIASIVIDEGGERTCLAAQGRIRNLRIDSVSIQENYVIKTGPVYYANYLNDGDCVEIQLFLPDVTSNLCVSYETDAGAYTYYVCQSGRDSSIFLVSQEDLY